MKSNNLFLLLFLFILFSGCYEPTGCYGPMTGTIVDAETGKPIEGAVVHVEWSVKTGIGGLKSGSTYKITEKVSDKDGMFRIWGVLYPMVNRPIVVVYKKDYVAWRNDYIFPDYEHRTDFEWKRHNIFKLDRFKRYSHSQHIFFFTADLSLSASSKLQQNYSWENSLARNEEELLRHKRQEQKLSRYTESEIWGEVVKEMYPPKEGGGGK